MLSCLLYAQLSAANTAHGRHYRSLLTFLTAMERVGSMKGGCSVVATDSLQHPLNQRMQVAPAPACTGPAPSTCPPTHPPTHPLTPPAPAQPHTLTPTHPPTHQPTCPGHCCRPTWRPSLREQLDPEVLAALPLSLQQEVLADLHAAVATASHGLAAAGATSTSATHVAQHGQHGRLGAVGDGPLGVELRPGVLGSANVAGSMQAQVEGTNGLQGQPTCKGGLVFVEEDPAVVRRMLKQAIERVIQAQDGRGDGAVAVHAGEVGARLGLLAELAVQWLLGLEANLEEVGRGLSLLGRLGCRHLEFAAAAEEAVGAVQRQVQQRFGFELVTLRPTI